MASSQETGNMRKSLEASEDIYPNTNPMSAQQLATGSDEPSTHPKKQPHELAMVEALKALLDNSITVMEYGSQVQFRFGYEEPLIVAEWVVLDEQLSFACEALLECGFTRSYDNERADNGFWDSQSIRLDLGTAGGSYVHLLTFSLVGLTIDETIDAPATFTDDLWILSPKPQRYLVSLIRHLFALSRDDPSKLRVARDLGCFSWAYLMDSVAAGKRLAGREETAEEYQARAEKGVQLLRSWDWDPSEMEYLQAAEENLRNA